MLTFLHDAMPLVPAAFIAFYLGALIVGSVHRHLQRRKRP